MKIKLFLSLFILHFIFGAIFFFWVTWVDDRINGALMNYFLYILGFSVIAILPNLILLNRARNKITFVRPQTFTLLGFPLAIIILIFLY